MGYPDFRVSVSALPYHTISSATLHRVAGDYSKTSDYFAVVSVAMSMVSKSTIQWLVFVPLLFPIYRGVTLSRFQKGRLVADKPFGRGCR